MAANTLVVCTAAGALDLIGRLRARVSIAVLIAEVHGGQRDPMRLGWDPIGIPSQAEIVHELSSVASCVEAHSMYLAWQISTQAPF